MMMSSTKTDSEDESSSSSSSSSLEEVWSGRRAAMRAMLCAKVKADREQEEMKAELKNDANAASDTVAVTAFGVAVTALILRYGGRTALFGVLGLNAEADAEMARQVSQVMSWKEALPNGSFFFGYVILWTAAKTLCLDPLAFALALASGVLFGGVVEGALISSFCAAVGGSASFFLTRTSDLRPKILTLARRNPRTRALEKAVADRGFVTVLALRLAPIFPWLPLGAYNYLYGATTMKFAPFVVATFLGSLKPYAFDSYLGILARDAIDDVASRSSVASSEEAVAPSLPSFVPKWVLGDVTFDDLKVVLVCGFFFAVGALAANVAASTWAAIEDEVQAEEEDLDDDDDVGRSNSAAAETEDPRDWVDVLELRETLPWQVGAKVTVAVTDFAQANEPPWSRTLRDKAKRAKFTLGTMSLEELALARYLVENDRDFDDASDRDLETFVPKVVPDQAELANVAVEAVLFSFYFLRTIFTLAEDDIQRDIRQYQLLQGGRGDKAEDDDETSSLSS